MSTTTVLCGTCHKMPCQCRWGQYDAARQLTEGISVTLFDRSNPHDVVAWNPPNNPKSRHKAGDITRLEDLKVYGRTGRTDIALVGQYTTIDYCNECQRGQYKKYRQLGCVYPTKTGCLSADMDVLESMTGEQIAECYAINQRIIEAAKQYPEMALMLDRFVFGCKVCCL